MLAVQLGPLEGAGAGQHRLDSPGQGVGLGFGRVGASPGQGGPQRLWRGEMAIGELRPRLRIDEGTAALPQGVDTTGAQECPGRPVEQRRQLRRPGDPFALIDLELDDGTSSSNFPRKWR